MPRKYSHTLCWDCERACGGCSWSQSLKPVHGWTATKLQMKTRTEWNGQPGRDVASYIVHDCPQFKRDAVGYGMKWTEKENTIIRRNMKKSTRC